MKLKVLKPFKILAPGNSLRKRTAYSLALVRLILVPVIVLAVYYLFRMGFIVDRIVNVDAPAANYALQASIHFLEARRAERNYFLLHDPAYVGANRAALESTRQEFDRIRELEPDDRDPLETASTALQTYQQRFDAAVSALEEPGQSPTDHMRSVIRAYELDLDGLLRDSKRHNKAHLLEELRKRVDSFDSQISETVQSGNPELRHLTEDLQTASQQILQVSVGLQKRNWSRVQAGHAEARQLLMHAEIYLSLVSFLTLLVSIWVSYVLPGQVVKPLLELRKVIDHAKDGNYEIELDIQGKGETADLARSLQELFVVMRKSLNISLRAAATSTDSV